MSKGHHQTGPPRLMCNAPAEFRWNPPPLEEFIHSLKFATFKRSTAPAPPPVWFHCRNRGPFLYIMDSCRTLASAATWTLINRMMDGCVSQAWMGGGRMHLCTPPTSTSICRCARRTFSTVLSRRLKCLFLTLQVGALRLSDTQLLCSRKVRERTEVSQPLVYRWYSY